MSVQVNSLKDGWNLPQLTNRQLMTKAWEIRKQAAKMWNRKPSDFVFSICIAMARKGEKLVKPAKMQAFIAKYKDKYLVITGNTYHNRAVLNSCKLVYAHRQWSGIINCEQQLMQLYFCKGLEIAIAIVDECYIARSAIKNYHIEG